MNIDECVFCEDKNGRLRFVGDFETLYKNTEEPWEQSGTGGDSDYYHASRNRVCNLLSNYKPKKVLEIGTGQGFALKHFSSCLTANYYGLDISQTAIDTAKKKFPELNFIVGDICGDISKIIKSHQFDLVILNQLLWYLLEDLEVVESNCDKLLKTGGKLIISNAFSRNQKYGTEIIDGFGGAVRRFESFNQFNLKHCSYFDDGYRNTDGVFVLAKSV